MSDDAEHSYEVALVEARRSIDKQLAVIETARGRAMSLVSVGGLLGTFVGGLGALGDADGITAALWVAVTAFGLLTLPALVVLWPYSFYATLNPKIIVATVPTTSAAEVDKWLAEEVGNQYDANAAKVDWLQRLLLFMVLALGVEFIALTVQLIRSA